jgi:hypothetical protein
LRENLTNEAIAARLGVTHAAAKYHVSEILSKLGVASREEAAAWEPEPEAAREPQLRRWGLGLVGWLRPVTLGKAALVGASLVVLAGMGVLAWGVAENEGHSKGPSAPNSIGAHPGALVIENPADVQLIITRPSSGEMSPGDMWLANLDGTRVRQLPVRAGVTQRDFIRVVPNVETGNPALYYSAGDFEGDKSVWRLDLVTLEEAKLGTIPKCCPNLFGPRLGPRSDVSPDGSFLILFDSTLETLIKRDLVTGTDVNLTSNMPDAKCELTCQYWDVDWSPNGEYILASHPTVGSEGARSLILDAAGNLLATSNMWNGVWSPRGDGLCSVSPPDEPIPFVEIRRAPSWSPQRFLDDLQQNLVVHSPVPLQSVGPELAGCTWTDDTHVAVWQSAVQAGVQREAHIVLLDTTSGDIKMVAVTHDCHFESLMSTGRAGLLIMRNSLSGQRCGGPFVPRGPNEVVDIGTGASTTNTEAGAVIEAVIPADSPTQSLRSAARADNR